MVAILGGTREFIFKAVEQMYTDVATQPSTILLAEDEEGVRAFLVTALKRAGHHVIATTSGPEAVEVGAATAETIDLLITDVVMPGLSGPDVAEKLRLRHPQMRTLFLSGYSSHAALSDRAAADSAAFLQKPFSINALLDKVRERLSSPRPA